MMRTWRNGGGTNKKSGGVRKGNHGDDDDDVATEAEYPWQLAFNCYHYQPHSGRSPWSKQIANNQCQC